MRKVKNSSAHYVRRSQVKSACVVVERAPKPLRKRTLADFAKAEIDSNFYVSFRPEMKVEKCK